MSLLHERGDQRPHAIRRSVSYVLGFLILAAISYGLTSFYLDYLGRHWQDMSTAEEQEVKKEFLSRFHLFEQSIHHSLDSVQALPVFQFVFSTDDDSAQEMIFFTTVLPQLRTNLSIEVYDEDRHLIGWNGPRGPSFRTSNLRGHNHTFVADDQIYTYLLVSHPLVSGSDTVGYLVGKRLLDVDYPINNRFINREAFQTSSGMDLPQADEYDFSPNATVSPDPHRISVEVTSVNGSRLGYAYLHREDLDMKIQEITGYESLFIKIISLVLVILMGFQLIPVLRSISSPIKQITLWTLIVWFIRYYLLLINVPSGYLHVKIFDPVTYASPFGYGLAKSPGDLFISCVFLIVNIIIAIRVGIGGVFSHALDALRNVRWGRVSGSVLLVLLLILAAALLRAYCAIIHSAVFDSTIPFYDPSSVLPSPEMAVMLIAVLSLTAVLVICSLFIGSLVRTIAGILIPGNERGMGRFVIILVITSVVGSFFGIFQDEPLVQPVQRVAFLFSLFPLSFFIEQMFIRKNPPRYPGSILAIYLLSVILLIPTLNATLHDFDRLHVELAAREASQPADAWLTTVVEQALTQLRNHDAIENLGSSGQEDIASLAFREWAKSILGREGYLCSVTYVDARGRVVSDFHIGVPPHPSGNHHVVIPVISPTFHTEERNFNGRTMIWHSGYESLISAEGDTVGGVLVEVSGSRQNLLESEVPEFLRNYSSDNFQLHFRPLIFSEYYQGKLAYSTADSFPLMKVLPAEVNERGRSGGLWIEEQVDGREFETYYVPEDPNHNRSLWIALSLPHPTLRWYFYSYLRYFVFFLILLVVSFILLQMYFLWKEKRQPTSYRKKVFIAFCMVSIIPVLILGYYNQQYTVQQSEEALAEKLDEQSSVILAEIQRQVGNLTPVTFAQFDDDKCAQLSTVIKTDFNLYLIRSFLASSKPEIFLAGVLDTRISADAYANIIIQKKKFFIEHQQIGALPFIVGYRPVIAEDGSVIGVIAVPTLYRQIEINEDLTRRNSFLYGVYALAIMLSILAATIFANQISSPIRRLTNATRQIGKGQLDVRLPRESADEMGQLEGAFQQMTEDLRKSQQEMMRAQRELAWREMAKQVAHEIKNPLTPMKLAIQHLRQAYTDEAKNFKDLFHQVSATLLEQIDALNRIASEFSQYAKMPERRLQLSDVQTIVQEAVNLQRQHVQISFREEYAVGECLVLADREELRRVFINILKNSIQAITGTGEIWITSRRVDTMVQIDITDTGSGITPDLQNKIFEPNFSTKSEGTGLGLAIVKQIIDDTHGTIRVSSTSGRGTNVSIKLPLAEPTV